MSKKTHFAIKNVVTSKLLKIENITRYCGRPVHIEDSVKFPGKVTRNVKVKSTRRPVYKQPFIQMSLFPTCELT